MEIIVEIAEGMTTLGLFFTPISFMAYIFMSCCQYIWGKISYTKGIKVLWYIAVGIGEIFGDERFYLLVVLMMFMDACDSFFEFLNERRDHPEKRFK